MTHYSNDPTMCRVDFFKPGGKWKYTEGVPFDDNYHLNPVDGLKRALRTHCQGRFKGLVAVCLHPYSKYEHPVMITDWEKP